MIARKWNLLLAVSLLVVATGASAANLISNNSFEIGSFIQNVPGQPHAMELAPNSSSITGWQTVGDTIAWIEMGNPYSLTASDGNRFLDLSGWSRGSPYGGVKQTISTIIGQRYTFSFDLGYSEQYGVDATIKANAGLANKTFTLGCCNGANKWTRFSFEFDAVGSTTDIVLAEAFPSRDYVGLDNVSVEAAAAPVPEPETYAMLLAGLGLLGVMARRRKQKLRS